MPKNLSSEWMLTDMKERTVVLLIFLSVAVSLAGYLFFHDGGALPFADRPILSYTAPLPELPGGSGFAFTPVIDAGHGGVDGGAVSPNDTYESQINLEIAQRTALILRLLGLTPVMTREDDISLHDATARTIREKKNSDLKNRVALIASVPNAVLVSIHQNSFPETQYHGAQVFHNGKEGNAAFADVMQEQLRTAIDPTNHRTAKRVDVYLMNRVDCPSVLIECGFLSNPGEELLLRNASYQLRFATAISAGLMHWYTEQPG